MMAAILNSAILDSAILHKKELRLTHLFILTQTWSDQTQLILMMAAILNSDTAILDSHLVIFSQIHSKTLSRLVSHSDSN